MNCIVVIAMGCGPDLTHLSFVGMVGMLDPLREGVAQSIATLHQSGVRVKMITGDARETGESIGKVYVPTSVHTSNLSLLHLSLLHPSSSETRNLAQGK